MPASLEDIPNEVVLEHLLPALSLDGISALSQVNRHFHSLTVSHSCLINAFAMPSMSWIRADMSDGRDTMAQSHAKGFCLFPDPPRSPAAAVLPAPLSRHVPTPDVCLGIIQQFATG